MAGQLSVKLINQDEELACRSLDVRLSSSVRMTSPIRAVDAPAAHRSTSAKLEGVRLFESYSRFGASTVNARMAEKDKENDQSYGFNGLHHAVAEAPLLVLQEFTESSYPTKRQTEYMVRTAHAHSEFVCVPLIYRLTDKMENPERDVQRYLRYVEATLDVIDTYNRKPVMAAVPLRIPFFWLADVVKLYCKRNVRAFCLDFAAATPETASQSLEQVLYALSEQGVLQESFIHGINVSPGRPRAVTPVSPCKSILSFEYGLDSFGDLHRVRMKMDPQPDRKPLPSRLFARADYGDHLARGASSIAQLKPDRTGIPPSSAAKSRDLARLFNAEQQGLESGAVAEMLRKRSGLPTLSKYLEAKTYVGKDTIKRIRAFGTKLGRPGRQKKLF